MRDVPTSWRLLGRCVQRGGARPLRWRRAPTALFTLSLVAMLLAALLSGCDAPFFHATTASRATPTATLVPTVAPGKGDPSTLPALPGPLAHCSQAAGFQNAPVATGGAPSPALPSLRHAA